jgi:hypothetical protein
MKQRLISRLINGFFEIEKRDTKVICIKINKKQLESLKSIIKENKIWNAKIFIDNSLKNPVIIGEDLVKAIFINNKWILRNIGENEKRRILEDKKQKRKILINRKKQEKEYKEQYKKYFIFKKQLKKALVLLDSKDKITFLEKFEFILNFISNNKNIPQG